MRTLLARSWAWGVVLHWSLSASPAVDRYVSLSNPSPSAPYTNWATAAVNIAPALAAAAGGDTVWVTNGTYELSATLYVGTDARLRSVNGREVTVIDARQRCTCIEVASTGAVVEGFTITRGAQPDYGGGTGGGVLLNDGGTVRNCSVTSNSTRDSQSGAGINLHGGGLVEDCLITCNVASNDVSGGGIFNSGGLVRNCVIRGNTALQGYSAGGVYLDWSGSVENCLIVSNSAFGGMCAGGVYFNNGGEAHNCTITGNTGAGSLNYCGGMLFAVYGWGGTLIRAMNTLSYSNSAPEYYVDGAPTFEAAHCCTVPALGIACVTNDPLFANAAAGDYRLTSASPCWNAGTNLAWMTGATDLEGYPRIIHGTSDIGAYELSLYHYASQTGSNAWPYLSLAAGATNIQDAIDASAAGDTVYVNDGIWRPAGQLVIPEGRDITLCRYNPSGSVILDGQNTHRVLLATNCAPFIHGFTVGGGQAGNDMDGGGGFRLDGAARVANCTFSNNYAQYYGGAIYGTGPMSISNCAFRSNGATHGGAVFSYSLLYVATMSDCRLSDNIADLSGGGASMETAIVERCHFEKNAARYGGGGVYLHSGTIRNSLLLSNSVWDTYSWGGGVDGDHIENCTIAGNRALSTGSFGGGAYVHYAYNCIVYDNQAPSAPNLDPFPLWGGDRNNTIPAAGSNCITTPPLFADAAAGDYRLAAASPCVNAGTNLAWTATGVDLDGVPRVVDSVVDIGAYERTPRHYVHIGGKAIWPYIVSTVGAHDIQAAVDAAAADDTVYIAAGTYTQGAEIAVTQRLAIVGSGGRDATFVAGSASNGCFSVTTHALLDGLTLTGGTAGLGGGLFLSGGGTARNVRVTGCTGTVGGGGVYFGPGGGLVDRSEMDNNRTLTFDGAGVYLVSGASLRNSLVRNNSAHQNGGGLFFDHGGLAENCTVVSNHASSTGGGANFYLGGEARNTILYFNTAGSSGPNYGGSGATMDHCCSSPSGGTGGVTGDPLFVSPAAANYRLLSGSPCIDSGTAGPPDDLDGLPRPLDGNRNGTAAWDIGAFEFVHLLADTDANGMPDGWELEHFGSPLSGADPAADPDGDGAPNGGEAAADTDPLNAASVFRIERFFDETEFYTVQFTSSVNRVYTLQGTADPADPGSWQVSGPPRKPGPGGLMSIKEENRGALRFDRVLVELPP